MKRFCLLLVCLAFAACENVDLHMHNQASFKTQEYPRNYNPVGSIPANGFRATYADVDGVTLETPFELTAEVAAKGQKLYNIYCGVCHAEDGKVTGAPAAAKMDLQPFDLTEDSVRSLTDGELFVKIVASDLVMPNYRNELSDEEAWEVVAYVRQLQK